MARVNENQLKTIKQNIKTKLTIKDIEQKVILMKEFKDNNNHFAHQMDRLY